MLVRSYINVYKDVQIILRAFLTKVEYNLSGYSLKVELLYMAYYIFVLIKISSLIISNIIKNSYKEDWTIIFQ